MLLGYIRDGYLIYIFPPHQKLVQHVTVLTYNKYYHVNI